MTALELMQRSALDSNRAALAHGWFGDDPGERRAVRLRRVAKLLNEGLTIPQIARLLGVKEDTIRNDKRRIEGR